MTSEIINVGIGFATGRKNFRKVLATYIYNMMESGITSAERINLHFFIAYDLKYNNTRSVDYTNIHKDLTDMIGDVFFLGPTVIKNEIHRLEEECGISREESKQLFENGYAGKRNFVLYEAIKHKMDCLLFLDDDEYPLAVTNTKGLAVWSGQNVLSQHLLYIRDADITNGHHCGYVSPIPSVEYGEAFTENDFCRFIGAISNDIVNWENIRLLMANKGVTYADTEVLVEKRAEEVLEQHHMKFITGANLCINLTRPNQVKPFYNPPGARGEDTFLSACLSKHNVKRIPCYTFHDGFSTYSHLLNGVLPIRLKGVTADNEQVVNRFYRACIGWVRYKPLLLYITDFDHYEEKIQWMQGELLSVLPSICKQFGTMAFMRILPELEYYHRNVKRHYKQFLGVQELWDRLIVSTQ